MSRVLTAKEICERALRAIGAFPITESAADGEQLREAMFWLDLVMAEIGGTGRLFFLVPQTIEMAITNGTSDYNLNDTLGAELPIDQVQFPVQAWLEDAAGNRSEVKLATRDQFEKAKTDGGASNTTGRPCIAHIDRLPVPTLRIYPAPAASDTNTYTLKLDVQTYAPNVAPGGVTGTKPSASVLTKFRQAWQRFLIMQLCSDLASGAIIKLPQTSINNFDSKAKIAKTALDAFENREHETTDPVGEPWGM